jgi:hypothetical protein
VSHGGPLGLAPKTSSAAPAKRVIFSQMKRSDWWKPLQQKWCHVTTVSVRIRSGSPVLFRAVSPRGSFARVSLLHAARVSASILTARP